MHARSANIRTLLPRKNANHSVTSWPAPAPVLRAISASVLSLLLLLSMPFEAFAQMTAAQSPTTNPPTSTRRKKSNKSKAAPCRSGCKPNTTVPESTATTPEEQARQKEMADLAHELRLSAPGAYEKLAAFANQNSTNVWGARAALALGYDDYSKNRSAQAAGWLAKAENDPVLRQYALFWSAQTKRALGRNAEAFTDLQGIERDYPNIAIQEQFLEAYAPTADELGHSEDAIEALNAYSGTATRPPLLLERAQAYQNAHEFARAAKDYQLIFYKFPLADEAKAAGVSLSAISKKLGKEYPFPGVEMQEQRAQLFFDAHKWKEARAEYEKLLTLVREPGNPTRQRAQLRSAECRQYPKASPSTLASLSVSDPEVDAERIYALSQAYRSGKNESEMLAAVEQLQKKYPQSKWLDEALMSTGNYYWVALDRTKATSFYQRVVDGFPEGKNAFNAEWRTAWMAFLNKQPDADTRLTAFLLKYPASSNSVDALYWLGRSAERSGNPSHARAYYNKAIARFPQTYFAHAAAARLAKMSAGPEEATEILAKIPPPPVLRAFDEPILAIVADRWARAQALRSIAFDSSAELELKAAYFATFSPRFLLEAAQTAFDQGHFGAGMAYGRLIVPNFDARKIEDIPPIVWKTLYPLPYEAALRREAARNSFDPMLAAGLIRQESTFQANAVSHANAIGLMQVLPKTGKILAKQLKVKYTKDLLFEPDYNLELGMVYIAELLRATGAPEYAAAAYNAGEDRVLLWKAERNYDEIPELVESIPFTETREYVQVVLRNAEVYRAVYGTGAAASQISASRSR
jgi:soluble lytic murein transglycosylase